MASVGDRIIVHGAHVNESDREGTIVEIRGDDGTPPYLVRWSDESEGLVYPGPDAVVQPE